MPSSNPGEHQVAKNTSETQWVSRLHSHLHSHFHFVPILPTHTLHQQDVQLQKLKRFLDTVFLVHNWGWAVGSDRIGQLTLVIPQYSHRFPQDSLVFPYRQKLPLQHRAVLVVNVACIGSTNDLVLCMYQRRLKITLPLFTPLTSLTLHLLTPLTPLSPYTYSLLSHLSHLTPVLQMESLAMFLLVLLEKLVLVYPFYWCFGLTKLAYASIVFSSIAFVSSLIFVTLVSAWARDATTVIYVAIGIVALHPILAASGQNLRVRMLHVTGIIALKCRIMLYYIIFLIASLASVVTMEIVLKPTTKLGFALQYIFTSRYSGGKRSLTELWEELQYRN